MFVTQLLTVAQGRGAILGLVLLQLVCVGVCNTALRPASREQRWLSELALYARYGGRPIKHEDDHRHPALAMVGRPPARTDRVGAGPAIAVKCAGLIDVDIQVRPTP